MRRTVYFDRHSTTDSFFFISLFCSSSSSLERAERDCVSAKQPNFPPAGPPPSLVFEYSGSVFRSSTGYFQNLEYSSCAALLRSGRIFFSHRRPKEARGFRGERRGWGTEQRLSGVCIHIGEARWRPRRLPVRAPLLVGTSASLPGRASPRSAEARRNARAW